jgi:hypothetical protein
LIEAPSIAAAPASEALVSMCTPSSSMMSRASFSTSIMCDTGAPW